MKKIVINRLFESFSELERAIKTAKAAIEKKKDTPPQVLERIASYEEILKKQQNLATALCGHASLGNWEEVSRHVRLINGLSVMIRDDARDVVAGMRKPLPEEQREMMLS